jgi:hypothetical protein
MLTLKLSAGAVFGLGLVTGVIIGAVGLIVVAIVSAKKHK